MSQELIEITQANDEQLLQSQVVFSTAEAQLISALADDNCRVVELIPDYGDDMEEAWKQLQFCLKVHKKAEDVALKLRPIIGKILAWARKNPEFYERHGFKSYDSFIKDYVSGVMNLRRTALYDARFSAQRLPDLTTEEMIELGPSRSKALAEAVSSKDSNFQELHERARNMTATDFKKYLVEKRLIEEGSLETAVIMIRATAEEFNAWNEFKECPENHAFVKSSRAASLLMALMAEGSYWRSVAQAD